MCNRVKLSWPSGVMPKRGLDVSSCEVYRFYKLVTIKSLIEPLSMIVPRRVRVHQLTQTSNTRGYKRSASIFSLRDFRECAYLVCARPHLRCACVSSRSRTKKTSIQWQLGTRLLWLQRSGSVASIKVRINVCLCVELLKTKSQSGFNSNMPKRKKNYK